MAEMCILVDRDDKATGAETKKACASTPPLLLYSFALRPPIVLWEMWKTVSAVSVPAADACRSLCLTLPSLTLADVLCPFSLSLSLCARSCPQAT